MMCVCTFIPGSGCFVLWAALLHFVHHEHNMLSQQVLQHACTCMMFNGKFPATYYIDVALYTKHVAPPGQCSYVAELSVAPVRSDDAFCSKL